MGAPPAPSLVARRPLALALALLGLLLVGLALGGDDLSAAPPLSAADPGTPLPTDGVVVVVNDQGFQPAQVQVGPGTPVAWVNRGQQVHSATSDVALWSTGPLKPGQWNSVTIKDPGVYPYHSDNDVTTVPNGDGTTTRTYNLTGAVTSFFTPTPTATPQPTPPPFASINITDTGYQPNVVTISAGGTVTFTNVGTLVHTATNDLNVPWWDTGGLSKGQFATVRFDAPGTYYFHSAPDVDPYFNFTIRGQVVVVLLPTQTPVPIIIPALLVDRSRH